MNATNEVSCFLIFPDLFVANLKLFHINLNPPSQEEFGKNSFDPVGELKIFIKEQTSPDQGDTTKSRQTGATLSVTVGV